MNLRKEIEKLLYWYIPIFIISSVLSSTIATYVKSFNGEPIALTSVVIMLSMFIGFLDNIVVGVWLYFIAKKYNQKYILWSLFGFVANIFGAVLFIALYIYEESNKTQRL
jgi:ABC-type methionine transport system permease subunit